MPACAGVAVGKPSPFGAIQRAFGFWGSGLQIKVSPEDQKLLHTFAWKRANRFYVGMWLGKGRVVLLHRVIAEAKDGDIVDHINGDPADNRRENLRLCSHAENMRNRKRHKNNNSGFANVYEDKRRPGVYVAQVVANGKKHRKYGFESPEAAHDAAVHMANVLHQSFSKYVGSAK